MHGENGEDVVPRQQRTNKQPAAHKPMKTGGGVPVGFTELRKRANQGDSKARAELKSWLDSHPSVWNEIGDLACHAQAEFLRLVTKGDFLFSEAIRRRAEQMRLELLGAFPSALEIVCVERIVASWLQVQYVEGQFGASDGDIQRGRYWLQRQLQANRLYHAAVKSLLLVRQLLPAEGPPAALTATGTTAAKLNGAGAVPINRLNGHAKKNGKHKALATA
jgi:hypothetical protein